MGIEWAVQTQDIGISHLALVYIPVPVTSTKNGTAYNPTSDTVQMAFMATPTQIPQVSDWQTSVWETDASNILYPYQAKCLVGPAGTITLGLGTYQIYIKITDNPEIPVLWGGTLRIS